MSIQRILVLGGGSAGLLAALTLKTQLPQLRVTVVRSQEIGVIGVGEGSTVGLPAYLHGFLRLDPAEFYRRAKPTWKLGLRFTEWGPRAQFHYSFAPSMFLRWAGLSKLAAFYHEEEMRGETYTTAMMENDRVFLREPNGSPRMTRDFAYHLENREFVETLETHATALGVELVDDKIIDVRRSEQGVSAIVLAAGGEERADLYVDCTGFASLLLGSALNEPFRSFRSSLFCDRAVIGGWARTTEPIKPYTGVQGMNAGWCWQIEHEHRINRGYVYSSGFISDDEAEREFRAQNPRLEFTWDPLESTCRHASLSIL